MHYTCQTEGQRLTVTLYGELDHHGAVSLRSELDRLIERERPRLFALCLSEVSFCDSSGLGLVMGRLKKCASVGASMVIREPSVAVEKILLLAGMDKLIKIERTERV